MVELAAGGYSEPTAESFELELLELELSPEQLRADPQGKSWLPRSLKEKIERNPSELGACLAHFVELELTLHDGSEVSPDAIFTSKVLSALSTAEVVDRRRRGRILAAFYALACAAAYLFILPDWEGASVGQTLENLRSWVEGGVVLETWAILGGTLSAGIVWLVTQSHSSASDGSRYA